MIDDRVDPLYSEYVGAITTYKRASLRLETARSAMDQTKQSRRAFELALLGLSAAHQQMLSAETKMLEQIYVVAND
jgi:hypothetical protein